MPELKTPSRHATNKPHGVLPILPMAWPQRKRVNLCAPPPDPQSTLANHSLSTNETSTVLLACHEVISTVPSTLDHNLPRICRRRPPARTNGSERSSGQQLQYLGSEARRSVTRARARRVRPRQQEQFIHLRCRAKAACAFRGVEGPFIHLRLFRSPPLCSMSVPVRSKREPLKPGELPRENFTEACRRVRQVLCPARRCRCLVSSN